MQSIKVKDFSLEHTIESGQFFNFFKEGNSYIIINRDIIFKVKQTEDILYYEGISQKELEYFFHLDFNLSILKQTTDKQSLNSLSHAWGLRIIRQDLWQCIIGFVCSAAANIEKIKMNQRLLSEYFGEKKEFEGKTYYTFPRPGTLDDENLIRKAKTGYRAKYIYKINQIVQNNPQLLEEIKQSPHKKAKQLLMELPGVGSKVADCILLFALQDYESFPVDTWVKKIFDLYYLEQPLPAKQIEKQIDYYFPKGRYRGIVQQYLFHYERNK